MTAPQLEVQQSDGVTVVVLGHEYDNLHEAALEAVSRQFMEFARHAEPPLVAVDMSRTRFFGSAFLGILFRVWQRLSLRQGRLAVFGAQDVCADVLRVTQVDKLWPVVPTREEAMQRLRD